MSEAHRYAIPALILTIPMAILIPSLVFEIVIVEEFLTSIFTTNGYDLNPLGRMFIYGGLLALPAALGLALYPMLKKGPDGRRRVFALNLVAAVLAFSLVAPILYGFGEEIYRCEILEIPNCD
jgi:hypothetical protein